MRNRETTITPSPPVANAGFSHSSQPPARENRQATCQRADYHRTAQKHASQRRRDTRQTPSENAQPSARSVPGLVNKPTKTKLT